MKKAIEKISETKRWFFEKINKIDKSLARLIKKKSERTQIRNERGEITTDTTEKQTNKKIRRVHYEQLHANKLVKIEEMDKFLETYNLKKLSQGETGNLNK